MCHHDDGAGERRPSTFHALTSRQRDAEYERSVIKVGEAAGETWHGQITALIAAKKSAEDGTSRCSHAPDHRALAVAQAA